jgi:hypothetical protein
MFDRLFKSEHKRVEEMLSPYLDGELSPKEQARVEKHLARCADCAQNLHTLRQTVALLGQLPPVAVPRSFAVRPVQVAQRPSFFQTRRAYVYLRTATAVATILFAVVLAGDAFLTDLVPSLAPKAPEVIMREVRVEKAVVETVVVEKVVPVTVEVEKEVVVEKEAAYEATPLPAPAEAKEEMHAPQPLPTPAAAGKEIAPATGPSVTPEKQLLAEAPRRPDEQRIEDTAISTTLPAEAISTTEPTLAPTPMPTAVRSSRPGSVLLRAVEASLLSLVLVLATATLVAKRRQGAG